MKQQDMNDFDEERPEDADAASAKHSEDAAASSEDAPQVSEDAPQDSIDDEFSRMMRELSADSDAELDAEIQALLAHDEDGRPQTRALVLTRIRSMEALSSILALSKIEADCVETSSGALAYMQIPASIEDDMNSLLGAERPMPPECDKLAREMSKVVPFGVVLLVSWVVAGDEDEPGLTGQITARRYVEGHEDEDLPAGLVIAQMDGVIEDLLLGRKSLEQVRQRTTSRGISVWRALRNLRKQGWGGGDGRDDDKH